MKYFALLMIALMVLFVGCDKKSDNPAGPGSGTAPTIKTVEFKTTIPDTTTNYRAQQTKSLVTSANLGGAYTSVFTGLPLSQNGGSYTYVLPVTGTFTETFSATKQPDGSVYWTWKWNGTLQGDTTTYNNYVVWEGTTSADGNSGNWKFYDYGVSYPIWDFVYATDSSGVLTGTYKTNTSATTYSLKVYVLNRPDGSGEVQQFATNGTMIFKATWTTTGSGTWWSYNNGGTQNGTGTWN